MYHYRARIYDPGLGRFCSRDPIGYWDSFNLWEYTVGRPTSLLDPTGFACAPQNHHWFPQKHKFRIEGICKPINFKIDFFTTPLNKCTDPDSHCDVHGWIHGQSKPGRPARRDWGDEVEDILNSSASCCDFLVKMAAEIASTYAEIADEFEDCNQEPCYRLRTFRPPNFPEPRPRTDTTLLFAEIVAACRNGTEPKALPPENEVMGDGGGLRPVYPEIWLIPAIPKVPRIVPSVPAIPRIPRILPEIPRRAA